MNSQSSYDSFKKSPIRSIKHSTYFQVYDSLFSRYIGKEFTFVEVGIFNGGSLRIWRDYFGDKARIIGIDINENALKHQEDGFEIYIGDQSDPNFWQSFFNKVGEVDILLDDGGHTYEQQIITTVNSLPYIKENGILVVEDVHTSYMREYGGTSKFSFIEYTKLLIDKISYRFHGLKKESKSDKKIFSIQIFESIVALHINRDKCSLKSKEVINDGKKMSEDYFVNKKYDFVRNLKFFAFLKSKIRLLKVIKYFK